MEFTFYNDEKRIKSVHTVNYICLTAPYTQESESTQLPTEINIVI